MKKLVESWIEAEREWHGNNVTAAVRALNETLGTCATPSRVSEWRRGVYPPSNFIISEMLYRTLPWALKKHGGNQAMLDGLNAMFWQFEIQEGQEMRHVL